MFIQSLKVIIFAKAAVYYQTNKEHPNKLTKARMQLAEIIKKAQAKIMGGITKAKKNKKS
ncbi:MAG: hypothetical protein HRT71_17605 [Flavobacteriales bacterium]|nr:hypothetical protein [Flavobacteriales bacterium]